MFQMYPALTLCILGTLQFLLLSSCLSTSHEVLGTNLLIAVTPAFINDSQKFPEANIKDIFPVKDHEEVAVSLWGFTEPKRNSHFCEGE